MTTEERDIQRNLECFNMPRRSTTPARLVGILELADLVFRDGETHIESTVKLG